MMFTFLRDEYRKAALGEYRRRLSSVCMALALLLAIAFAGMALPSYISLRGEVGALKLEREAYSKKMQETGQSAVEDRIGEIGRMTVAAEEIAAASPIVSVLDDILSKRSPGVALSSISLERKKDGWAVSIAGSALTREELVEFSKGLESAASLSGIDLPVSSLAKNKDVPFSMTFRSKF